MVDTVLVYLSATVTFVLLLVGVLVTLNSQWVDKHKSVVVLFFMMFGGAGMAVQIVQGHRALEESEEQLLHVLGDAENPPYLWIDNFDFASRRDTVHARLYLANSSPKYAARNVSLTLNIDGQAVASGSHSIPPSPFERHSRVRVDSTTLNGGVQFLPLKDIGVTTSTRSVLSSSAGTYRQITLLSRASDSTVLQAMRLYDSADLSTPKLEIADPDFPSDRTWPKMSDAEE